MKKIKTLLAGACVAIAMISACVPAVASPGEARAKQTILTSAAAGETLNLVVINHYADLQISAGVFVNSEMKTFYGTPQWLPVMDVLSRIQALKANLHHKDLHLQPGDRKWNPHKIDIEALKIPVKVDTPPDIDNCFEIDLIPECDIKRAFGIPDNYNIRKTPQVFRTGTLQLNCPNNKH